MLTLLLQQADTDFEIQATRITHKKYGGSLFSIMASIQLANDRNALTNRVKGIEGVDICLLEEADDIGARVLGTYYVPTIRKQGSEIWAIFNPSTSRTYTYQTICYAMKFQRILGYSRPVT